MNLFLYGTLRPGFPLWRSIEPAVRGEATPATLRCASLYYHRTGAYPVLYRGEWTTTDSSVYGTLVYVPDSHAAVADVMLMEVAAGYSVEWVRVNIPVEGRAHKEYTTVDAVTFTWQGDTDGLRPVPGNDWSNAEPADWPRR